jgi:MFS transporter, NNP family, nitrate/nitrite transporter
MHGIHTVRGGSSHSATVHQHCRRLFRHESGKFLLDLNIIHIVVLYCHFVVIDLQHWTSGAFASEIVGTANGLTAGWGNLGAGVTNIVMGSVLFPLMKHILHDAEKAWRTAFIVPSAVALATGILVYCISDDTPKGNIPERIEHRSIPSDTSMKKSFLCATSNINTWILFVQYGCCFGVQITMNNAAAMYFRDEFGLSTESAAAISSIFSWMLLFARALGGFASDIANYKFGMRGRIAIHTLCLVCEGGFVVLFGRTKSLASAIATMIVFSLFVDAATGSTYGIVPYVAPTSMGSVIGVVAAGGSVGASIFGVIFRQFAYEEAFLAMGLAAAASGLLSLFINIEGHSRLLPGDTRSSEETEEEQDLAPKQTSDEEAPLKKRKSSLATSML